MNIPFKNNVPVEGKVWGGAAGGGVGLTVSTFVLWVLGVVFWKAPATDAAAADALSAVPFPVAGLVVLLLGVGGQFLGGYLTKHTPRPALDNDV